MSIIIKTFYCDVASMGKSFSMSYTIKNNTESAIPADTRLWYHGDALVVEESVPIGAAIPPYSERKVTINLQCNSGITWKNMPGTSVVSLRVPGSSNPLCSHTWRHRMGVFVGKLHDCRPSLKHECEYINILITGFMGAGKSSFINTCATLMSRGDNVLYEVAVGGSSEHNTTEYAPLQLEGTKIQLCDTWGMDGENYADGELELSVDGMLPMGGFSIDTDLKKREIYEQILRNASTRGRRMVHAVLFFVPFALLDDNNLMAFMNQQLKKIKQRGHNAHVIVARLDEAVPQLRDTPNGSFAEVEQYRMKASQALGVPPALVRYMVPYTKEQERSFEIERLCYGILHDVVVQAGLFSADASVPPGKKTFKW